MKNYAIYIYSDKANGNEKWNYKGEISTDNPEAEAINQYHTNIETGTPKIKVKTFEAKIHINDIWYKSMVIAFNGKGEELVLAERMGK